MNLAPRCQYCQAVAELVDGTVIYPNRPDLKDKNFWLCVPCDAFVGCHRANIGFGDGTRPFGTLADADLRLARRNAHLAFDSLWATKPDRRAAYRWLAEEMQINIANCHIAMFDLDQCAQVQVLAHKYAKRKRPQSCEH